MGELLRDRLLAVPGIAGAEVDSDGDVPGVRVQLAVGADPEVVGAAVRRVLAAHGMRPLGADLAESSPTGPPPPPGAPGSVVSFPLLGEHARADTPTFSALPETSLESVALVETSEGVSVSVRSSDGRVAERALPFGMAGMEAAVVEAVAEMFDRSGVELSELSEHRLGDQIVVTVLLSVGENPRAGSAVQHGGRAFAVGRATWTALRAPG